MSDQPLDLDALTALEQAATPGPWEADDGGAVWSPLQWTDDPADTGPFSFVGSADDPADAALIAALRNAAPALIAAAEERDAAVERANFLADQARENAQLWPAKVAAARAEVAALRERVEAVHRRDVGCSCDRGCHFGPPCPPPPRCSQCRTPWPCATVAALDADPTP